MIPLFSNETIEDLQLHGLRMIQGKDLFRFGEDSVLLVHFVSESLQKSNMARRSVVDLGCNCGSISLLLSAKLPNSLLTGVEITPKASEIFKRNIELNHLQERISCVESDWNHLEGLLPCGQADIVVSNPPYRVPVAKQKAGTGATSSIKEDAGDAWYDRDSGNAGEVPDLRIAREEIHSSLDQLLAVSAGLLKDGGKAFFVYRANRLVDVLEGMRKHRLEPRSLRMVHPFADREPKAFLVTGQKSSKPGGFIIQRPLILFDRPGHYTEEVTAMYGKYPPLTQEELYSDINRQ
jgi:tRNA1Val (adenine37-N6)-methyltransferase